MLQERFGIQVVFDRNARQEQAARIAPDDLQPVSADFQGCQAIPSAGRHGLLIRKEPDLHIEKRQFPRGDGGKMPVEFMT